MTPITPRPLEWVDHAPVLATATRAIPASPDAVWAVLADHERWPEWFSGLKAVETTANGGQGVGGGRRVHLGPIAVDEEFLAWEPGRRFAFTVTHSSGKGVKSLVEDIRITPSGDDGCSITYTMALDVAAARVVGPVLRRALTKNLTKALGALAERA